MAAAFRTAITNGSPSDILQVNRGIEKEGLRVSSSGHRLSQKPHPTPLGSALTHNAITTDYSEALLEFITGVHDTPEGGKGRGNVRANSRVVIGNAAVEA